MATEIIMNITQEGKDGKNINLLATGRLVGAVTKIQARKVAADFGISRKAATTETKSLEAVLLAMKEISKDMTQPANCLGSFGHLVMTIKELTSSKLNEKQTFSLAPRLYITPPISLISEEKTSVTENSAVFECENGAIICIEEIVNDGKE